MKLGVYITLDYYTLNTKNLRNLNFYKEKKNFFIDKRRSSSSSLEERFTKERLKAIFSDIVTSNNVNY